MVAPAKILVVDDELSIRLTVTEMLSRDGYQVTLAENGQAALNLIATQVFDLALIDLKLGDMDGTEILEALHHRSPDTIAIMLTAHGSLESAVTALREEAHDYLLKPCSPSKLRESIRQGLLKRQREIVHRDSLQLAQHLSVYLQNIQAYIVEQPPQLSVKPPADSSEAPVEEQKRFLRYNNRLVVDFFRHIITLDDHLLELSPTEFNLLVHLIREAPRIISPQELLREVQGYVGEPWQASEIVRAHISHLRRKLKVTAQGDDIIRTVRGVGYTLVK